MMDKVRIDKWLWSVRIFKSRSLATKACRTSKVKLRDINILKPSYLASVGEIVEVRKAGFNLVFKIKKLIEKRVSATLAQECYQNVTSEAELNKYKDWFIGKAKSESRDRGAGRPTKKEKREIDGFKEEFLFPYYYPDEDGPGS